MKISDDVRFPHPILGLDNNDYISGDFISKILVKEDFAESTIEISVEMSVSDETLAGLVQSGKAAAGFFINCPATYLNTVRRVQLGQSKIEFPASQFWGRVVIRPMIWSNETVDNLKNPNVHPEFSEDGFGFAKGAPLAFGDEIAFSVGRDKLAPIESIFEMRRVPTYSSGKMSVSLNEDKIIILLAPDVHEAVSNLRANSVGKAALMNSVYLPAVMEVLSSLGNEEGNYEGTRWYQAFVGKCEHLGIQFSSPNIFEDAQQLLDAPASSLRFVADRVVT